MVGLSRAFLSSVTPQFNTSGIVPDSVFAPVAYSGNGGTLEITNNLNMANALSNRYGYYANLISPGNSSASIAVACGPNNTIYLISYGPVTALGGSSESDNETVYLSCFAPTESNQPSLVWSRAIHISDGGASGGISNYFITVDASGNVYATFYTSYSGQPNNNTYIYKYSPAGLLQWQQELINASHPTTSMDTDSAGNLYVAVPQTNNFGITIFQISPNGNTVTQLNYGFTYTVGDRFEIVEGTSVTSPPIINAQLFIDASNNLYLGWLTASGSLGNTSTGVIGPSVVFGYAKISTTSGSLGTIAFSETFTNPPAELSTFPSSGFNIDIVADSSGNIYYGVAGNSPGYIIKINPTGGIVWAYSLSMGNAANPVFNLAIDSGNNLYASTVMTSSVGFDGTTGVAKINGLGQIVWQAQVNSFSCSGVAVDINDNVYMSGILVGDISSNGGATQTTTETVGYVGFTPTIAFLGTPSIIDSMSVNSAIDNFGGNTYSLSTVTPIALTLITLPVTSGGVVIAGSTLNTEMQLTLSGGTLTDAANSLTVYFSHGNIINDTGFLTWIIDRGSGVNALFSSVVGLISPSNSAESQYLQTTATDGLVIGTALGVEKPSSTGFTVGSLPLVNTLNDNYISYTFLALPNFFDIVTYQGNGTVQNVPHQLGTTPAMIIVTSTSGDPGTSQGALNWIAWTDSSLGYMFMNKGNSAPNPNQAQYFGNGTITVLPSSTQFTVGSNQDVNGINNNTSAPFSYVAFLFASTPGVTCVGTYTGNGTTQAVNCEFNSGARFVLIGSIEGWYIYDTARGITGPGSGSVSPFLTTAANAENTTDDSVFPSSAGFAVSSGGAALVNQLNVEYVFLAIA